jgi:ATP-dependent protease ClpP protease subunit
MFTLRKDKLQNVFKAEASGTALSLEVYDIIGADIFGDGITAEAISEALRTNTYDSITLRVNSPGGDAFEGVAIYNLLKNNGKPVNVYVDGLAASAASIICMAGDTITMGEASMMMIHNAIGMAYGNADDLRSLADTLDKVTESIADVYVNRTKNKKSDVLDMMTAETWMTAKEAVKNGFATEVAGKGGYKNSFDLSAFKNTPEELKVQAVAEPVVMATEPTPEPVVITEPEEDYKIGLMRKRIEIEKRK